MKILPTRNELMNPTIEAIRELGGSANTDEIYEKIVDKLNLSNTIIEVINGKTGQSELQYNLSWVRTILKNKGILSKGGHGIWVLNDSVSNIEKTKKVEKTKKLEELYAEEEVLDEEEWKQ